MVFPNGYLDHPTYTQRLASAASRRLSPPVLPSDLKHPPCLAVDLFALAGTLLLRSGAYHHVQPLVPAIAARALTVTKADRDIWTNTGAAWRGTATKTIPQPPVTLMSAWADLLTGLQDPLFELWDQSQSPPKWWRAALALFCIADEAALNIGFDDSLPKSAQAALTEFRLRRSTHPFSISLADRDCVCVLPKSRTPSVGCTIRSLSHNLCLLPPRGLARAYWRSAPSLHTEAKGDEPFNLVIVPLPYEVRANAFEGHLADSGNWGWFEVQPHWCPRSQTKFEEASFSQFWEFIDGLLTKAESDVGRVHGLVFPEVAMSSQVFLKLCELLKGRKHFELLISGLFDAPLPDGSIREGNFTGMARFDRGRRQDVSFGHSIREKHHRWRIDRGQIETYALGAALDINTNWWEHIDILSRSLDIFVLRGGATVTTLICEDLARSDPCQELVRGIGPNFVVALLMDGPQLRARWPARYGTVLADDPGSAVLTVTSLGLIKRSNDTGAYAPANQIALFQDDRGKMTEIRLPTGAQAMCITLQPSKLREVTLDGREDDVGTQAWRLSGVVPVTLPQPNKEILKGEWPKV